MAWRAGSESLSLHLTLHLNNIIMIVLFGSVYVSAFYVHLKFNSYGIHLIAINVFFHRFYVFFFLARVFTVYQYQFIDFYIYSFILF